MRLWDVGAFFQTNVGGGERFAYVNSRDMKVEAKGGVC